MTKQKQDDATVVAKTISIGTKTDKLQFEVAQPYVEGHTVTAIEAKVLNQVRAENVGNNMRSKVQDHLNGKEGAMTIEDLTTAFAEYDAGYEFTIAATGGSSNTLTPVERAARKIATSIIMAQLKAKGRKKSDVNKDAFADEVARFASNEKVIAAATKQVDETEALLAEMQ